MALETKSLNYVESFNDFVDQTSFKDIKGYKYILAFCSRQDEQIISLSLS